MIIPIIVALLVLIAGAAYLLTRRNRPGGPDGTTPAAPPATDATRVTGAAGRADDHDDHDTPTRPDVTRERRRSLAARLSGAVAAALGFAFLLPATVAAHTLNATYASRLPLAVYLVGAADDGRPVVHLRPRPRRPARSRRT